MTYIASVDVALLGANFYAAGYGASTDKSCVIIERKSVVGSDFAQSLNSTTFHGSVTMPKAKEFQSQLVSCGVLNEKGNFKIIPSAKALSDFIVDNGINILLETETISVEAVGDGFEVTIFNRNGYGKIFAKQVIDTNGAYTEGSYCTLGLMITGGTDIPQIPVETGFIQREHNTDELIFHLKLKNGDNMVIAKEKLRDIIEKTDLLGDWKACSVASAIAWHYPTNVRLQKENGVILVPSASYGNLLNAMEGGARDATADNSE